MPLRLSRRAFLAAPLPIWLAARGALAAPEAPRVFDFTADVGILFGLITFTVKGTVLEEIDQAAGRYHVSMRAHGEDISLHTEAGGMIRQGRYMPVETHSESTIRGRDGRLDLRYDYDRGAIEYHSVAHTFFLGRRREVDDTLRLPADRRVDDLLSAELNFAANTLDRLPDGTYSTFIVRRSRPENEAPDDVSPSGYHAELIPLRFQAVPEGGVGRLRALIDITSFSSWARQSQPAHVTFGLDRRLESVETKLILGTTFKARLAAAG